MAFVQIVEDDGTRTFQSTTNNARFNLPAAEEHILASEPVSALDFAVNTLGELMDQIPNVEGNALLSQIGKERAIEPVKAKAIEHIARAFTTMQRHDRQIDAREASLVAVPAIDQTHSVAAIESREIRDWYRSQSHQDRINLLGRIQQDPRGNEYVLLALLRSPIPILDHEVAIAKDIWGRVKREANPAEAVAIENARAASTWARRGLSNVTGLANSATGWDGPRVLRQLLSSSNEFVNQGFGAYGFSESDAAQMRVRMNSRQAA